MKMKNITQLGSNMKKLTVTAIFLKKRYKFVYAFSLDLNEDM